jgi:hypothetical protein
VGGAPRVGVCGGRDCGWAGVGKVNGGYGRPH